jgi:carboxy-terminal domain RNA polymerase II polypeptide A small phosphatase
MDNTRPLLILDLNGTLIFAEDEGKPCELPTPSLRIPGYSIWKRPFLDPFLDAVMDWFEVAVWTSSGQAYTDRVVPAIFPHPQNLRFVWTGSQCTARMDDEEQSVVLRKNLDKVERQLRLPLEKILILDDNPRKLYRHYGNLVPVSTFEGNPLDTDLRDILAFLQWISTVANVREVEKRHWRRFGQ